MILSEFLNIYNATKDEHPIVRTRAIWGEFVVLPKLSDYDVLIKLTDGIASMDFSRMKEGDTFGFSSGIEVSCDQVEFILLIGSSYGAVSEFSITFYIKTDNDDGLEEMAPRCSLSTIDFVTRNINLDVDSALFDIANFY